VNKYYFDTVQTIVRLKQEGESLVNISSLLGIRFPKVKEILIEELKGNYRFRTRISPQLKEMIITLAADGDSNGLISKKTKVSISSVKRIVEKPFHYIYDLIMTKTQLEFQQKRKNRFSSKRYRSKKASKSRKL